MIDLRKPINLTNPEFVNDKYAWYERIREEAPVHKGKVSVLTVYTVSRYEDCAFILKDPRILRNRAVANGGGSRFPFPLPGSVKPLVQSMIITDEPEHRRLRELVRRAFRPQAIQQIEESIVSYTDELLDGLAHQQAFELQSSFALPIPVRMIGDMLGVKRDDMPRLRNAINTVTEGFGGLRMLRTLLLDLPSVVRFMRELIGEKRTNPGDDILTELINTTNDGDQLTEDELVAMAFLLVVGGYETTVHLITNGILTLLQNPEQLARLREEPHLAESAIEEILRHRGPIHGTKPGYPSEDITLHGVTIPRGKPIMPLLGAANHDPRVFENPQTFDIARTPNRHLGFGHGVHFCLGSHLARMEARIAIMGLIQRFPDLHLACDVSALEPQAMPLWHRYRQLPLATGLRRSIAKDGRSAPVGL